MLGIGTALSRIKFWMNRNLRGKREISVDPSTKVSEYDVIGEYTSINCGCRFHSSRFCKTIVGKFCSIGNGCKFIPGNHPTKTPSTSVLLWFWIFGDYNENALAGLYYKPKDISIGNDVWIGTDTIVLSGVNIGNGAIIGQAR